MKLRMGSANFSDYVFSVTQGSKKAGWQQVVDGLLKNATAAGAMQTG